MNQQNNPSRFLRLPQVLEVFPVSASRWWAGVAAGEFPKPVKLTERITAWRSEDIDALIKQRGAAS